MLLAPTLAFGANSLPSEDLSDKTAYKVEWLWFRLPSGLFFLAHQLVPTVEAKELSLKEEIILYIRQKAQEYGLKEKVFLWVAKCESNYVPTAIGDKGSAYGLWQFWEGTFNWMKKEAKMTDLKYKNWKNQTELAAWAWANDYYSHWSCWKQYHSSDG